MGGSCWLVAGPDVQGMDVDADPDADADADATTGAAGAAAVAAAAIVAGRVVATGGTLAACCVVSWMVEMLSVLLHT